MKKKVDFVGSIQEVLWNYLGEEQQRRVAMVLGSLKKGSQQEVCVALVDYMETGRMVMPKKFLDCAVCEYLINPVSPLAIRPLRCSPTVGNGKLKKLKTYVLVSKKRNLY